MGLLESLSHEERERRKQESLAKSAERREQSAAKLAERRALYEDGKRVLREDLERRREQRGGKSLIGAWVSGHIDGTRFAGIRLENGMIRRAGRPDLPLAGAHATVETAGQITQRLSAPRIVGLGVFALAAPKRRDNRELYLHVDTLDGEFVVEVDPSKGVEARRFATAINNLGRQYAARDGEQR